MLRVDKFAVIIRKLGKGFNTYYRFKKDFFADLLNTEYCCCSTAKLCPTLRNPMDCSMPGFSVLHCLPGFTQTYVHQVCDAIHLILFHPLLLLPSIFPSMKVFSNESVLCIRWPKDWSFSFSISPSNEYSGLISFRIHWLDLLAAQGTLENLLQHHSTKASILWLLAFFIVQLSYPYMTTGKPKLLLDGLCWQSNISAF